jgi:peroxiredoxin
MDAASHQLLWVLATELGRRSYLLRIMSDRRVRAGEPFPPLSWPRVGGGTLSLANDPGWRLLVVYRGSHCGLCREYLAELNGMLDDFRQRGISVAAASADTRDKAEAEARDGRLRFPIAYDLSTDDMRRLGLYISPPQPGEASRPFAEPALFVVNPEGRTQVIAVTNAPFSRPDLKTVLGGLRAAQDEHAPIHGTAA